MGFSGVEARSADLRGTEVDVDDLVVAWAEPETATVDVEPLACASLMLAKKKLPAHEIDGLSASILGRVELK